MLKALVLASGLNLAAMSAVEAGPLFDSYQALCVKSAAQPTAALTAADSAGWTSMPDALLLQLGARVQIDSAQGRINTDGGGPMALLLGHKEMPVDGTSVDVRFCALGASAVVGEPAADELASWAAVPSKRVTGDSGQAIYFFTNLSGVHTAAAPQDAEQLKALIQSGHANIAFSQDGKGLTFLAFLVPTM